MLSLSEPKSMKLEKHHDVMGKEKKRKVQNRRRLFNGA
jgi:hypothetical protein